MANTTLFTYSPGENMSTYSNPSIVPIFLDEPINFTTDALRIQAELTCQGDVNCLFDIASTGDVSVGASTKQVAIQLESESKALGKYLSPLSSSTNEYKVLDPDVLQYLSLNYVLLRRKFGTTLKLSS